MKALKTAVAHGLEVNMMYWSYSEIDYDLRWFVYHNLQSPCESIVSHNLKIFAYWQCLIELNRIRIR